MGIFRGRRDPVGRYRSHSGEASWEASFDESLEESF